jgi:dienelactone hydrolase
VLLISGQSGPGLYAAVAQQFAAQGFHVALIDGNDMSVPTNAGRPALAAAVAALKASPKTTPGKIGVVGSSLGGAAALAYAARMPAEVAAVVAYYPVTFYVQNIDTFARQIRVPTLVLAGVQDTYKNCCTIEKARKLKAASPRITLVEYPQANHGFNLAGPTLRAGDAADALRRAVGHLRRSGLAVSKSK